MGWWDDVKFVVTGEQTNAVKATGQAIGQAATGATLGQAGFGGVAAPGAAANAVGSGNGSAGTISMNREEMEDTLKRAENLLKDIMDSRGPAARLTNMQPPASDPSSVGATDSANNAGKYYVGHLQRQQAYLNKVIAKMKEALGQTAQTDQDVANTINSAGEGTVG